MTHVLLGVSPSSPSKGAKPLCKPQLVNDLREEIELLRDLLPDYSEYRDEGCDLFPCCLNCPLPRCRYDKQADGRRASKRLRDREILRQRSQEGKSVADLARSFGVSKRTVQRIIRRSASE